MYFRSFSGEVRDPHLQRLAIFEIPFVGKKILSFFVWHISYERGCSLLGLVCPSRCTLCISLFWRSMSSSSAILNKIFSPSSLFSTSFSTPEIRIFSLIVLFFSAKLKNNHLFSEPSHCVPVLFLRQADSTYFHVQPSFFLFHLVCFQGFVW